MISRMLDTEHITAMARAARQAGQFDVHRDNQAGTIIITHEASKREVLRGLRGPGNRTWLTRFDEKLFVPEV